MNHLSDEFTHSTVTSEAAKDSPTVHLVRYLIDQAHSQLDAVALADRSTRKALMHAHHFLTNADETLIEEDYEDENVEFLAEQSAPVITDLTALLPGTTSLHSFVINWSDQDTEQGTFGTTVRAFNGTHGEYLARAEMEISEGRGSDFTGSVVDHNVGASWKADDLEQALRDLVEHFGPMAATNNDAMIRAKALLAEIDAIA